MTEQINDNETEVTDGGNAPTDVKSDNAQAVETPPAVKPPAKSKKKFSGDYYYVDADRETLSKSSFIRTLLTVIALMLQIVVLLLPQGGLEYITKNFPSYAYVYMWAVFVMLAVSVYVLIMNFTRYKLVKRIPKERAPSRGFKNRTFFGTELFMAINALILAIEISFVCISYDGVGLAAVFICAAALAASVLARQTALYALRSAELIRASESEQSDKA